MLGTSRWWTSFATQLVRGQGESCHSERSLQQTRRSEWIGSLRLLRLVPNFCSALGRRITRLVERGLSDSKSPGGSSDERVGKCGHVLNLTGLDVAAYTRSFCLAHSSTRRTPNRYVSNTGDVGERRGFSALDLHHRAQPRGRQRRLHPRSSRLQPGTLEIGLILPKAHLRRARSATPGTISSNGTWDSVRL
jgi:hypothetical protein